MEFCKTIESVVKKGPILPMTTAKKTGSIDQHLDMMVN
jgi:hypothetical protein